LFSSEDNQNASAAKQATTGTQVTIKGQDSFTKGKTGDDEKVMVYSVRALRIYLAQLHQLLLGFWFAYSK